MTEDFGEMGGATDVLGMGRQLRQACLGLSLLGLALFHGLGQCRDEAAVPTHRDRLSQIFDLALKRLQMLLQAEHLRRFRNQAHLPPDFLPVHVLDEGEEESRTDRSSSCAAPGCGRRRFTQAECSRPPERSLQSSIERPGLS